MKIQTNLPIILLFFLIQIASAQTVKFGEISMAELQSTQDSKFPEAPAVVLYRNVDSYLGNYIEVHERIKIYNEEGYEYATVFIPYPDIKKVKGATYNLVDGQIQETELEKDLIFEDEVIKDVEFKKFTFPNVSPGSVLEYTYITDGWSMRNIDLQYDIPIRKERVEVTNKSEVGVEILQNPRAFLNVNRVKEGKSTIFTVKDVAPLEEENYVYDMDVYRSYIKTNLTAVGDRYRFGNWEGLGGIILGIDDFRMGVKPKRFYKDDLESLLGEEKNKLTIAEKVYGFLKEKVKWNKEFDYVPDESIREIYMDGEGNSAGINLLYISMLRSLGMTASPVLVSTKLNGIPLTASLGAFNAVLADVVVGQKHYLVDVASKNSTFHYLDPQFMNWQGLRIYEDDSYDWVQLNSFNVSNRQIIANAKMTDDGVIEGNVKERHSGYFGLELKRELEDLGAGNTKDIIHYNRGGLEIFEVEANPGDSDRTEVAFEFEMDNAIDEIDGKLYFSPLLFFALDENPFLKEERKYAIDFGYPFKQQAMITIDLPEGYAVESTPEPAKLVVEKMGSFLIRTSGTGNKVQVMASFEIDNPFLPFDKYDEIRGFFMARMQKEAEKVVLNKV